MKAMYNQPTTEVMYLKTERLMDGMKVSPGAPTDPSTPPGVHIPSREELIP